MGTVRTLLLAWSDLPHAQQSVMAQRSAFNPMHVHC